MGDFIFSVNCLQNVQKMTHKTNSLFGKRSFKLVKTGANKKAKVVLSSLEKICSRP